MEIEETKGNALQGAAYGVALEVALALVLWLAWQALAWIFTSV